MTGAEAPTETLPTADPGGPSEPPRLRRRAERRAAEKRRGVPWLWIVGGLVALTLAGRGVIGAAMDPGRGSPSAAPTAALAAGTVHTGGPVPSVSVPETVDAPPTAPPTTPTPTDRVVLPRSTRTATASPSTSTPAATLTCSVQSRATQFWGGYNATITVRNTGRAQVNGWRLTFRLSDTVRIVDSWGGTFSRSRGSVQVASAGPNASLVPGGSVKVGYRAEVFWGGVRGPRAGDPSGFALNGVPCS